MKIGLFLEDVGHHNFITSLIRKVASQIVPGEVIDFDTRNATGGKPSMEGSFRRYILDYLKSGYAGYDMVVAAQDTDCRGVPETKNALLRNANGYSGPLVIAAPNPCIEAWYLADQEAIRNVAQANTTPPIPAGCDCASLKTQLRGLFREGGVDSLLNGAEYADDIVGTMDLARARRNVASLNIFFDDLRTVLVT